MNKKFNNITNEFIEAMNLENVQGIRELEDKVVVLDILQRKRMLNSFILMISAFIFFGLQFLYKAPGQEMELLMFQVGFYGCFITGGFSIYKALEAGTMLSDKVEAFNLAKHLYIDMVRKNILEVPSDLEMIIDDLVKFNIYSIEEASDFKTDVLKKKVTNKSLIKLALELRTLKSKISASDSMTVSLEEHRKDLKKEGLNEG